MSSLFSFLHEVHSGLSELAAQAEQTVWGNPRSTLIQGRLFGEQMATYVSQKEGVEPVYAIKQIDRIHKLSREGIISDEIRGNFEWIRMNGNTAAHDSREIPVDIALTAHRQLFELAVWFAETYGPLSIQPPAYSMPMMTSESQPAEAVDEQPSGSHLSDQLEKLLHEQLEAKLLPSLDEKFRDLQETLLKFAGSMDEWSRRSMGSTDPVVEAKSLENDNAQTITTPAADLESEQQIQHREVEAMEQPQSKPAETANKETEERNESQVEIAAYLQSHSLNLIDKRGNGGALWVVGGWELKDELFALKPHGLYFRFARNGSQSTKRKPAWFLMGKDPTVQRWVNPNELLNNGTNEVTDDEETLEQEIPSTSTGVPHPAKDEGNFQIAAAAEQSDAEEVQGEVRADESASLELDKPETEQTGQSKETLVEEKIEQKSEQQQTNESVEGVIVPLALHKVPLESYAPSPLSKVAQELDITVFEDWTEDRLRELYRLQPKMLHDVLVQLWFFGVRFTGELTRFIKLQHDPDGEAISHLTVRASLSEVLPLDVSRLLERFGICSSEQLNGIPLRSLEWLLRGRFADTMQILEELKQLNLPSEDFESLAVEADTEEDVFTLYLLDQALDIPVSMANIPIEQLSIQGCPALLRGLKEMRNVTVIRELPTELSVLAQTLRGVGIGAVRKFFEQLAVYVNQPIVTSEESLSTRDHDDRQVAESKYIVWRETTLELNSLDTDMPLIKEEFPTVPRILQCLIEDSIVTLGQLPANLAHLLQYPRVGETAIEKFFVQLQGCVEVYRVKRQMEQEWNSMSIEERICSAMTRLMDKWSVKFSEQEIAKIRNYQILHFRWQEYQAGRKATLEQMGQSFGLTRERVRQIINKLFSHLQSDILDVEKAIRDACENNEQFFSYSIDTNDSFGYYLMAQVLNERGIYYLDAYGYWTTHAEEVIEQISDKLTKQINESLRARIFSLDDISLVVKEALGEFSIPVELALYIVQPLLRLTVGNNQYILANMKKYEVVEMVLHQYPEGIEVYKRAQEMLERANTILPGQFDKERDITSVVTRDDFADSAYLWGRGQYIHPSYIQPPQVLIEEVSTKAIDLLEQRSPISVGRLFHMFSERLEEARVPNEYALYTMLRKYGSNQLALHKFPHIWHEEDTFQLSNAEQIKVFIREHHEPLPLEILREEFITKRGWKPFTLGFSITSDDDFVNTDLGVIGLREFYPFQYTDFKPVFEVLVQLLEQIGVVHVNRLYEEATVLCNSMGIISGYLLYDLLQGMEDVRFRFARYPLISSADQPLEDMTLRTIIEQFIQDQGAEVPREVVYQWVTEEVGARVETLDGVLSISEDIFYYRSGQFGEYIHREWLDWTADKENKLIAWVSERLKEREKEGLLFITIDELWEPERFPSLYADLPWTEDLFIDCLRKSRQFQFIGSYDYIIVPMETTFPNESSWVAHILKQLFGGRAPLRQFQQRLTQLRYSKDGKFLFETAVQLENGEAPFSIVDDTIVLNES